MPSYYLQLAMLALKRNIVLTILMVVAIGLGIGATMTMVTAIHVMSRDPLPGRSQVLFYPHLDPLPRGYQQQSRVDPSENFTLRDATAITQHLRAEGQPAAMMAGGRLLTRSVASDEGSFYVSGRFTEHALFPMFRLNFLAGAGWGDAEDEAGAMVVVISSSLQQQLFPQQSALGKMLALGGRDFRVVGVVDDFDPEPKFYGDIYSRSFGRPDQFYLPLQTAINLGLSSSSQFANWGGGGMSRNDATTTTTMRDDKTSWLQLWTLLETPAAQHEFADFLRNYSQEQHRLGRFERAPDSRMYNLTQWLQHEHLVPDDILLQLALAIGFLLICIVNVVALMMSKFLRRTTEVSLRRALGATKRNVFFQLAVEACLIGLLGGLIGIATAYLGVSLVRGRSDDYAKYVSMDLSMLFAAMALALLASLLASVFPAWRASQVAPAVNLKGA